MTQAENRLPLRSYVTETLKVLTGRSGFRPRSRGVPGGDVIFAILLGLGSGYYIFNEPLAAYHHQQVQQPGRTGEKEEVGGGRREST